MPERDESGRPVRAGQAFLEAIKDNPESQAALRRAQTRLQAFGIAARAAMGPVSAARSAAPAVLPESLRAYRSIGAAMGDAMRGNFERLQLLVDDCPDLREAAEELKQTVVAMKQADQQRRTDMATRLAHIPADLDEVVSLRHLTPPAFDDPEFWSSIKPIGERIRDAVREELQGREPRKPKKRMKLEHAEPLIADHLTRRPDDTVTEVAKAIGCSAGSVSKSRAWKANMKRREITKNVSKKTGVSLRPNALSLDMPVAGDGEGETHAGHITIDGDNRQVQERRARERQEQTDDEIDERERELFRLIAEVEEQNPGASDRTIAQEARCKPGDVKRWRGRLKQLRQEQAESRKEDEGDENGRQTWVRPSL